MKKAKAHKEKYTQNILGTEIVFPEVFSPNLAMLSSQDYFCENKIDLCALTETWLSSDNAECTPTGYQIMIALAMTEGVEVSPWSVVPSYLYPL